MHRLLKQGAVSGLGGFLLAIPWAASALTLDLGGVQAQVDTTVS